MRLKPGLRVLMKRFCACFALLSTGLATAQQSPDPVREMESGRHQDREGWFRRIRENAGGRLAPGGRAKAIREMQRRLGDPNPASAAAGASAQWSLIGPQPAGYESSGRVTALAIDPNSANTLYLGAAEGGVWKTTDGGLTWTPLTDQQPSLAIGSLAIDPNDSNTIYAGTGESNFNIDAYYGAGVLKSSDGGATWTNIPGPFTGISIGAIAVSPSNSQRVVAGAFFGIYVSTDAGATWNLASFVPSVVTGVFFDPTNANTVYAAAGDPVGGSSGVYKSTDGGDTWTTTNGTGATALPLTNTGRIALAMDPSSPNTLYAGIVDTSQTADPLLGVYKTTDGGNTWNQISSTGFCTARCWYNNVIAVSPSNPLLLAGGGVDASVSLDGGATWSPINPGGGVHVDQHAVAFSKDGSLLYLGNDGGVWVTSTTIINSSSFQTLNNTLALTQFYPGVSTHPTDPTIAFGGTQDNTVLTYQGKPQWRSVGCGDGAATAVDPVNPQNVYIGCGGTNPGGPTPVILRSTLGGSAGTYVTADTGLSASEGVPFIPYMTIDPTNPQNLYFTGNRHVYQTIDGAQSWTAISPDVTNGSDGLTAIAVAPADSNTVYSGSLDGAFQMTSNAGAGVKSAWTNRSTGLPGGSITHIEVSPKSAALVYATVGGSGSDHVFRSADGGATWTDISGDLPDVVVSGLAIDPDLANTFYIATDIGVFWTTDGGVNWSPLTGGLPLAAVLSLNLHEPSRTLRAATHGRSVWDMGVSTSGLNLIPEALGLAPAVAPPGASGLTLTVNGANFVSGSVVRWNGTNRPTQFVSAQQLTATLGASDLAGNGFASISVSSPAPGGGVSQDAYLKTGVGPAFYPNGLLNGASFGRLTLTGLAPGSIVSLFGVGLAASNLAASSAPLPIALGGTEITLNGTSVPEFFVSPGQVNVQIPWEAANIFNPSAPLVVSSGANVAQPIEAPIGFVSPGIFTLSQNGSGQGTIAIASTGQLAAPAGTAPGSRPAKRGEYITIYCTGLGPVDNTPLTGYPTPASPLANAIASVQVVVGGVALAPSFAGLAPGYVGLNQVNVQLPASAPVGNAVTLAIVAQGVPSNLVTLAVQ